MVNQGITRQHKKKLSISGSKLFSDMKDADYYIQAAKRLQKKNNGYKLKIIVFPWYSCAMFVILNKHDNR
ncbi:unnamed protein product [Acanthoscelides obtectus]|uniref:Uncharacterized protein n=1 Tax=Acanthoscelides obtectus TaxID=200917 RepID=A0A9P0MKR3_ACAOB|nr:unnamed protein product [Acanthoscelides obtectus]CAK1626105.1 hypothetical protein AOBTE_LOCUS3611 [Acanthoscelides obtectus]